MTSAKAAKLQDTFNYPPRGLDADRAAAYCGVSKAIFLKGVENGEWPQPKDASGQTRWDRVELDAAWDSKGERARKRSSSARRTTFDDLMEDEQNGGQEIALRQ
jgi:predicted DNA-binding transcriptional regulator AlpA